MSCGASELALYAIGHTPCSVRGISHRNKASFHYNTYSWNNLHRWKVHIQKATRESATMPYGRLPCGYQAAAHKLKGSGQNQFSSMLIYLVTTWKNASISSTVHPASSRSFIVFDTSTESCILCARLSLMPLSVGTSSTVFALPVCFLRIT